MKSLLNAIIGMAVISAAILCLIGATGYLLYDGHFLFAVAELAVFGFAAKPMLTIVKDKFDL